MVGKTFYKYNYDPHKKLKIVWLSFYFVNSQNPKLVDVSLYSSVSYNFFGSLPFLTSSRGTNKSILAATNKWFDWVIHIADKGVTNNTCFSMCSGKPK